MISSEKRFAVFKGILVLASLVLFAGCGRIPAGSPGATSSPTLTPMPSPTATATATATATVAPTHAPTSSTCLPDADGFYASQAGFVTNLDEAPLPAPPKTKHGIGSGGAEAGVIQAGESGVCTIGTFASITAFYTQRLPSLGWQYSAPPTTLDVCFQNTTPAKVWWKGSETFIWYDSGNAGGGSIFWSYTYCLVQS